MHSRLYVRLMNSKRWRVLRGQVLSEQPLCADCYAEGVITPARDCHHIIPIESGGNDMECERLCYERSNVIALCHACHKKRHEEMRSFTKVGRQERTQSRLAQWTERRKV